MPNPETSPNQEHALETTRPSDWSDNGPAANGKPYPQPDLPVEPVGRLSNHELLIRSEMLAPHDLPEGEDVSALATSTSLASAEAEAQCKEAMVTVHEAAERLGITPRAVQRIVAKGHARAETRPVWVEVPVLFVNLDELNVYRARVAKFRGRPKRNT